MKRCENCGRDISENARVCPHCGYDYDLPKTLQKIPINQLLKVSLIITLILGLVLGVLYYQHYDEIKEYKGKFKQIYTVISEGAPIIEECNLLAVDVIHNIQYHIHDPKTCPYTCAWLDGPFLPTTTDAVNMIYSDSHYKYNLYRIQVCQEQIQYLIDEVAEHPKYFDEAYQTFHDAYIVFMAFADMPFNIEYNSRKGHYNRHTQIKAILDDLMEQMEDYIK